MVDRFTPTTPVNNGYSHESHGTGYGAGTGICLRDWLAGMALQGELASQGAAAGVYLVLHFPSLARRSFLIADAMIEARKSNQEKPTGSKE